ncbi:MAG TPA: hypothetical protein VKB31_07460 [Trueperaceae bacterium]|nr:hypothetical protein [Trueperaceae bacterium]
MSEVALWRFFRDVRRAVARSNRGQGMPPYRHGTFLVDACAGDVELTIQDVTEEDAVLIAGELSALGARAVVRGSRLCPHCGMRVPDQDSCVHCRRPLGRA